MKKTIYGVVLIFVVLSVFAAAHIEKIEKPVTFAQVYDIETYTPEVHKVQIEPVNKVIRNKVIIDLHRNMTQKAWVQDSNAIQRHLSRLDYNQ